MKKCRIRVIGKVQGVAFRYYTKKKADELGLLGSVENKEDGSVEIVACGSDDEVSKLIDWCSTGSPASRVEKLDVEEMILDDDAVYLDFSILR